MPTDVNGVALKKYLREVCEYAQRVCVASNSKAQDILKTNCFSDTAIRAAKFNYSYEQGINENEEILSQWNLKFLERRDPKEIILKDSSLLKVDSEDWTAN